MAQPSSFVNVTRQRATAFLKAMEDMVSLQAEFNSLGATAFTDLFDFGGEIPAGATEPSKYDLTQAEFTAGLTALGQMITAFQGTNSVPASTTRLGALYRMKS